MAMAKTFIGYGIRAIFCDCMLFLIIYVFNTYFIYLHDNLAIKQVVDATCIIVSISYVYYLFCMLVIILKKIIDTIYGWIADD